MVGVFHSRLSKEINPLLKQAIQELKQLEKKMSKNTSIPYQGVIRINEVLAYIGISRSTLYEKINPKSKYFDESFPQPVRLGLNSVGWIEGEVITWIKGRR